MEKIRPVLDCFMLGGSPILVFTSQLAAAWEINQGGNRRAVLQWIGDKNTTVVQESLDDILCMLATGDSDDQGYVDEVIEGWAEARENTCQDD